MLSYQVYKVMHLSALFFFLTGAAVLLLGNSKSIIWKLLTGIASLLVLVAGMGLMARLGHGMESWIQVKIVIWFLLTGIGHLVAKRFPKMGFGAYWVTLILAIFAVYLAVYKPNGTITSAPPVELNAQ